MNTKVRPLRRWALILSVANIVLYGLLAVLARRPSLEGAFANADVDFYTPLSERIAIALDAPALFIAYLTSRFVGNREWSFVWGLGVVPTICLWYFIGLWIDRFRVPVKSKYVSAWREPSRLIAAGVLCGVLLFIVFVWPGVLREEPSLFERGFEVVASLIVWPIIIGVIACRTIWRGAY